MLAPVFAGQPVSLGPRGKISTRTTASLPASNGEKGVIN